VNILIISSGLLSTKTQFIKNKNTQSAQTSAMANLVSIWTPVLDDFVTLANNPRVVIPL